MSFNSLLIHTCVIQARTIAQDAAEQEIETWANVSGLTAVPCRLDARGQERHEVPDVIWQSATNVLYLKNPGSITLSVKTHRIVTGGKYYTILWIPQYDDSAQLHHLELLLEQN
jgi:hypothetical protein